MFCNAWLVMTSIAQHFAENTSNRESQPISPSAPAAVTAAGAARPTPENGKVAPPRRVANRERRTREHLTPQEVDRLIKAASQVGRHGHRDACVILVAYRHGLRVSELAALHWDQRVGTVRCRGRKSTNRTHSVLQLDEIVISRHLLSRGSRVSTVQEGLGTRPRDPGRSG